MLLFKGYILNIINTKIKFCSGIKFDQYKFSYNGFHFINFTHLFNSFVLQPCGGHDGGPGGGHHCGHYQNDDDQTTHLFNSVVLQPCGGHGGDHSGGPSGGHGGGRPQNDDDQPFSLRK